MAEKTPDRPTHDPVTIPPYKPPVVKTAPITLDEPPPKRDVRKIAEEIAKVKGHSLGAWSGVDKAPGFYTAKCISCGADAHAIQRANGTELGGPGTQLTEAVYVQNLGVKNATGQGAHTNAVERRTDAI
jgi:hypothetical protein